MYTGQEGPIQEKGQFSQGISKETFYTCIGRDNTGRIPLNYVILVKQENTQ